MKGTVLTLSSTWTVGDQLERGGFGCVYELEGGDRPAVAKFVPKEPGADRELLFADLKSARNVVPIIDWGDVEENWVLVMPRAEKSLRKHLEDCGGVLAFEEVLAVLVDVAETLVDLDGDVVHRDLKPENILLLDGSWCLADFGISRYAEASTAPDTHKFAMTPAYGAPERWRAERATSAADVYALGVMGFEMLKGNLPFPGPQLEDYRDQHLHVDAPAADGVPVALTTVLDECLFKAPAARPSPENLLARLTRQQAAPPSGGLAALQAVNQEQVRRQVAEDRAASVAMTAEEVRKERARAGKALFERITNTLRDVVMDAAPAAKLKQDRNLGWVRRLGWEIKLGDAALIVTDCETGQASWGMASARVHRGRLGKYRAKDSSNELRLRRSRPLPMVRGYPGGRTLRLVRDSLHVQSAGSTRVVVGALRQGSRRRRCEGGLERHGGVATGVAVHKTRAREPRRIR